MASDKPHPNAQLTVRGVNTAGLIGSLYYNGLANAADVHLCLDILLEGPVHFDRLCAMHALVLQSNDKLCKSRNIAETMRLRDKLVARSPGRRLFLWGPDENCCFLVAVSSSSRLVCAIHLSVPSQDIIGTIDRWSASQGLRRIHEYAAATHGVKSATASGSPSTKARRRDEFKKGMAKIWGA